MRHLILLFCLLSINSVITAQVQSIECYHNNTLLPPVSNNLQNCPNYSLVGSTSVPTSELDKWLPDQYTPIKTINLRFVIIQHDANDKRNFDLSNPQHVQFIYDFVNNANTRLSNLQANVNPSINSECDEENRWPRWVPKGSSNTFQDSRIRVRVHEIVERINPNLWSQDYSDCDLDGINETYKNEWNDDAMNVYLTSSAWFHERWVNQGNPPILQKPSRGGCAWGVTRDMSFKSNLLIKSLYPEYYGKCNGGNYSIDEPICSPSCCQWADNSQLLVHEMMHNLGVGHLNTLCPPNYMSNGSAPNKNTFYNYQIAQANRQAALSNTRDAVNECVSAPIDRIFTSNYLFDENQKVYQNLIISSGVTVTVTCELKMPNTSVIIVEPGGKLIVDGGKITNFNNFHCGNEYWRGIEVLGTPGQPQNAVNSGIAEFKNGAVIENASVAVKNYYVETNPNDPTYGEYKHFGGIIRANNSIFLNNSYSVEMLDYQNFHAANPSTLLPDISYFINCDFVTDDNFRPGGQFNRFIGLSNVSGLKIRGCEFKNLATSNRSELLGGTGIYTMDASFSVIPKSNSVNAKRSRFENLRNGIKATGSGSLRSFSADKVDFVNNTTGVYVSAVDMANITRCVFEQGDPSGVGVGEGIFLIESSGFQVANDTISFDSDADVIKFGIRVLNAGSDPNELYDHDIREMDRAIQASAVNRGIVGGPNPYVGLEIKCTDFNDNARDIFVPSSYYNLPFQSEHGIKEIQGNSNLSAGNEFDPMGSEIGSHYEVGTSKSVAYYGHNTTTWGMPIHTSGNFGYISNENLFCPELFDPIDPNDPSDPIGSSEAQRSSINSEYGMNELNYANLYFSYEQMIDGGNTPALLNDIQAAWSGDAWTLRNELLASSPLSEDALIEAAQSGDLPTAMLFEVCLANPDATRDEGILNLLQYEIPNPLNQTMIDLLISNWEQETPLTILEGELGQLLHDMEMANNRLLRDNLFDTTGIALDSIDYYLSRNATLHRQYQKVNWLLDQGLNSDASALLTALDLSLPSNEYIENQYQRFFEWNTLKQNWNTQGKTINTLDSSVIPTLVSMAETYDYTGAIARNILEYKFGYTYDYPIESESGSKRAMITSQSHTSFKADVYPNPAEEYVSFTFSGMRGRFVDVKIISIDGQLMKQFKIDTNKPVRSMKTSSFPTGLYIYQAFDESGAKINGKLTIK